MHTLGIVLSAIVGAAALLSASGKLAGVAQVTEMLDHVGVSGRLRQALPFIQIAGGLGAILGLFWLPWLGVVATAGLAVYFLGAVVFHLRVEDGPEAWGVPAMLNAVALVATIARAGTL